MRHWDEDAGTDSSHATWGRKIQGSTAAEKVGTRMPSTNLFGWGSTNLF